MRSQEGVYLWHWVRLTLCVVKIMLKLAALSKVVRGRAIAGSVLDVCQLLSPNASLALLMT